MLFAVLVACAGSKSDDTSLLDTHDTVAWAGELAVSTSLGSMTFQLDLDAAPLTSDNFRQYLDSGFFDGTDGSGATIFHRAVPGFVIQGGGLTVDMNEKDTLAPIANESDNGLSNLRGTIAMARTSDPDSATSQFFINLVDNPSLDIDGDYPPGYAVFGTVVGGMDVVDAIALLPTTSVAGHDNVPAQPVIIEAVTR